MSCGCTMTIKSFLFYSVSIFSWRWKQANKQGETDGKHQGQNTLGGVRQGPLKMGLTSAAGSIGTEC